MSDLGEFEGRPVVASKVVVKKAGDGLSKPLAAEPRTWKSGERLPMLLWGTIGAIDFDPTKEGIGYVRVHDFDTEEAAVLDHVDPALLDQLMASQREKVADYEREQTKAKLAAEGAHELPLDGDGATEGVEGDLPVGDWQGDAAATPPTSISGRKRRGAAEG